MSEMTPHFLFYMLTRLWMTLRLLLKSAKLANVHKGYVLFIVHRLIDIYFQTLHGF